MVCAGTCNVQKRIFPDDSIIQLDVAISHCRQFGLEMPFLPMGISTLPRETGVHILANSQRLTTKN